MTSRLPTDAALARPAPDFDPVPLRYRRDGCTPERQAGLIRALAESGSPRDACRRVGLSLESAYRLYRRPGAASFRRAWDAALAGAKAARPDAALVRAVAPGDEGAPWHDSTSSTFSTSALPDRIRITIDERIGFTKVRTIVKAGR